MTVTMLDSLPVPTAQARPSGAARGAKPGAADFNALVETAVKARSAPPRRPVAQGEGKDVPRTEGKAKKAVSEADAPSTTVSDAAVMPPTAVPVIMPAQAPADPVPVALPVQAQGDPAPAPQPGAEGGNRPALPSITLPAQAAQRASVAAQASPVIAPAPAAPEIAAAGPPTSRPDAPATPAEAPPVADASFRATPSPVPLPREIAAQLVASVETLQKGAAPMKQAPASSTETMPAVADAPVQATGPATTQPAIQVASAEPMEAAPVPASEAPVETPVAADLPVKTAPPARRGNDAETRPAPADNGGSARSEAVQRIVHAMVPPAQVVRAAQAAGNAPAPATPAIPAAQVAAPSTGDVAQPAEAQPSASAPAPVAEATALLGLVADTMPPEEPGKSDGRASPVASVALARMTPGRRGNREAPRLDVPAAAVQVPATKARDAVADAPSQGTGVDPAAMGPSIASPVQAAPESRALAAQATAGTSAPDLGATLGQSVVDIASGNQWLDGLAKEISSVATSGGQGSFHLSPQHLGEMRVDIRDGALGTEAAITVKSEAARAALAADADLGRPDPQSAVRIADIRVDRAASVGDAGRSDMGGQSMAGQGGWNQGHGQSALAQGSGQGGAQGQHRGNAPTKVSPEVTVLGSGDPQDQRGDRAGQNGRGARYA